MFLRNENNENAAHPVRVVAHQIERLEGTAAPSSGISVGAIQREPIPSFASDLCKLQFHATLELQTPLRVLLRHGEQYLDNDGKQPAIARAAWEGLWVVQVKTWKELSGVDIPEFGASVASDVGPVMEADYLPFLIALRHAVESEGTIEQRIEALRAMGIDDRWSKYLFQHGGADSVVARFSPAFLDTLPTVTAEAAQGLSTLALNAPNKLAVAPDKRYWQ